MAISFGACSNDDDIVLSVSDFVLDEPYSWNLSKQSDAFYVVNSKMEMLKYIESPEIINKEVNTPDFDKYTLLLASGRTRNGVEKIVTKLTRHNSIDYTFEIFVLTNATTVPEGYIVAVTVPKLGSKVQVGKKVAVQSQGDGLNPI